MAAFFSSDTVPSSEATKMSIGECYNLLESEDLCVPDFQREYVWSKKQQQAYLESLSKCLPLFGPVINIDTDSGKQWIMDGQNRLMTIFKFMKDEITFENETKEIVKYSELPDNVQRKIKNTKVSYTETRDWTQEQCQEFFMIIQEGVKLKDGEMIHAKPNNPLTEGILRIHESTTLSSAAKDGGIGLSALHIKRYGHYEIIGTIIHMIRTNEYPVRPGNTALREFNLWGVQGEIPTSSQKEICITEARDLIYKYSKIIKNVPRLKGGVKKEEHLRLMYFIYKSRLWLKNWSHKEYTKVENMLNRVLNKENPEYKQIISWGTGDVEEIYNLYLSIFNEQCL